MHAKKSLSTFGTIGLLFFGLALTTGCRGGKTLGSFVKVSKEPDAQLDDVEAPNQRLAINDRGEDTSLRDRERLFASDDNPHVRPHQSLKGAREGLRPQSDTIAIGLTDRQSDRPRGDSPRNESDSDVISRSGEKTGDPSPEVVELANQLLMRQMTATAQHTGQPGPLEFEGSLDDLPVLRDLATNEPSQALRLASMEFRQSMMEQKLAEMAKKAIAQASAGDEGTGESPVVHAFTDKSPEDEKVVNAGGSRADETKVEGASATVTDADDVSPPTNPSAEPNSIAPNSMDAWSNQDLYRELVSRLNQSPLGETEADRNARIIKQRHLMMLAGNPDAAVEAIQGMGESEQEFLRHYLLGMWTMVDPNGHPVPGRRFTTALPEIRQATKYAAEATDALDVGGLAFCERIESYGQTVPFEGNRFDAGQQVILYCEIDNFTVEKASEGFKTHVEGSYDIYNSKNEKIVSQALPSDEQISTNHLRDYFVAYKMYLPKEMDAGTSRLQLTMADSIGKKYGQASIPFEIAKK